MHRAYPAAAAIAVGVTYALLAVGVMAAAASMTDPAVVDRANACTIPAPAGSYCHELDQRLAALAVRK